MDESGREARFDDPPVTRVVFARHTDGGWRLAGVLAWLDDETTVVRPSPSARAHVVTAAGVRPVETIEHSNWGVTESEHAVGIGVRELEGAPASAVGARLGEVDVPIDVPVVLPLEGMMCRWCDPTRAITACPYFGQQHP